MNMNPEGSDGVPSESWQNCARVELAIKMQRNDEQVEELLTEAIETSMLTPNNSTSTTASITSSFERNKLQSQFVEHIAEVPVIKADKNIDTDQLTKYSSDRNEHLIEEFENEVNFSLKTYIKSEPTTSVKEADEPLNQSQNSHFSEDTIKEENCCETKVLICEEIDIKSEDEESNQSEIKWARVEAKQRGHTSNKNGSPNSFNQCPKCPYRTYNNWCFKEHQLVHASKEEVELHKCPECPFTSKWDKSVIRHLLVHKNLNKVTWYRCPKCPFKTKLYTRLKHSHMLKHNKKGVLHKCTLCSFESPRKSNLQRHLEHVHRTKDTEMIGCPEEGCSFKTHNKYYLPRHLEIVHKSNKTFKCLKCSYETKYARGFRDHELKHENPDKWFSCSLCPYKTPWKSALNKHSLQHKNDSEIKWFLCLECAFKSKWKYSLIQHKLSHNKVIEKVYECSECCYKTAIAQYLRQHLLTHKEPGSETWFRCAHCPYKAARKSYLKQHLYTHKSAGEIQKWFRCPTCSYKSHIKGALKKHQLVHRNPEDITNWYYCYICTWKTKYKAALANHIYRKHRDAEGRICGG